jgi:ElaB/YqjD/DUF883 family membrane-anchored ribosome-binding protein
MATATQKAKSQIQEQLADMAEGMHDMAEGMQEMAGNAMESVGHGIEQAREKVHGSVRSAKRSMAQMEKSFEETVAERPFLSVGTAFGIGVGIVFGMWALDCFMNRDR